MRKGYWIAQLDVTDAEQYKTYVAANAEPFAKYGGKFLTRGGAFHQIEGKNRSRNVVLEFPSEAHAISCYYSPEYQNAKSIRDPVSVGDIIIMEGYDGPQPPELPGDRAQVQRSAGAQDGTGPEAA